MNSAQIATYIAPSHNDCTPKARYSTRRSAVWLVSRIQGMPSIAVASMQPASTAPQLPSHRTSGTPISRPPAAVATVLLICRLPICGRLSPRSTSQGCAKVPPAGLADLNTRAVNDGPPRAAGGGGGEFERKRDKQCPAEVGVRAQVAQPGFRLCHEIGNGLPPAPAKQERHVQREQQRRHGHHRIRPADVRV